MSDTISPPLSPTEPTDDVDAPRQDASDESDRDSELSEIDEDQFEDYDPTTAQIEERPVNIDDEVARTLKASKRKRTDGETSKKPKEGRREKKRRKDDDDDVTGEVVEGKRRARGRGTGDGERSRPKKQRSPPPEENEENLTPEERRRRAIDRAVASALKKPSNRRRKADEQDLEAFADEQIAALKIQMEQACVADIDARQANKPAVAKVKLLPDVISILNRNDIQATVLDPETNFLQAVKFFLEPLNDGSLPAYNIQRDIFTALLRLPIEKDALISSGIGKVVLFYTRSKRAEVPIKRMAEKLLGEWSRPILKRTDDYKKRFVETRDFNPESSKQREGGSQVTLTQRPAVPQSRFHIERERALAPVIINPNRARPAGLPQAYTVAPKSTYDGNRTGGPDYRPIGAEGLEAFRRMAAKNKAKK